MCQEKGLHQQLYCGTEYGGLYLLQRLFPLKTGAKPNQGEGRCQRGNAVYGLVYNKRKDAGEFVQASFRGSAAVLGIAFIQNIYGNAGMAPLMIIGTVPLYNIAAVTKGSSKM